MNLAQNRGFSSFTINFIPHDTQMYWGLHTALAHFDKINGKKTADLRRTIRAQVAPSAKHIKHTQK